MQWDLSLLILVVELLQVSWVKLHVVFQDKGDLLEVLLKQESIILWEYVVLIQHIVITFNIEQIVFHGITILVEVFFYHKRHVAETKVNHISEYDPVSSFWFASMAVEEIKFRVGPVIVRKLNIVAFNFTSTHAVGDMVSIND